MVEELRTRARDALLTKAIAMEEQMDATEPAADLLGMDGMDEDLAFRLASKGIKTMEDLAELSIADMTELTAVDEQRAGELIMAARAPWFADEENQ
jgi:N utilization substance protein A